MISGRREDNCEGCPAVFDTTDEAAQRTGENWDWEAPLQSATTAASCGGSRAER